MKRFLVDLDVVLDVLLDREPHVSVSAALWAAVERGAAEGWIAAHGVSTAFYLVSKAKTTRLAHRVVRDLLSVFRVAPVEGATLHRAADLAFDDFDDAVVAAAAEAVPCDAIVTRNIRDFRKSPVDALEPALALALLELDSEIHEG